MNVTICSRKAAEELLRADTLSRTAVISFCDPPSVGKPAPTPPLDYAGKAARVFTVVVHDLDLTALPDVGLDYDTYMPEADAAAKASAYLDTCMQEHDSSGGVIECIIDGMPAGIGEPVFDKLDADLAKAIFSIGAVKGFEIGDGFLTSFAKGSENNDAFFYDENGNVCKKTNHAGGILGGMSDGAPIVLRAAVKPTPSIFKAQQTVNRSGENITLEIKGRHDPVIVPRAVVVVESMAALVLVDALMENMSSRLEHMIEFYNS